MTITIPPHADPSSRIAAWRRALPGDLDHGRGVDRIVEETGWTLRYAIMIALSAGMAVLSLLLSSPAVVIGASTRRNLIQRRALAVVELLRCSGVRVEPLPAAGPRFRLTAVTGGEAD